MEQSKWGAEVTGKNQRSAPLGKEGGQPRRIRDTKMAARASESLTHGQNIFVCGKLHRPKVAACWRSATDDLIEVVWLFLLAGRICLASVCHKDFRREIIPRPLWQVLMSEKRETLISTPISV